MDKLRAFFVALEYLHICDFNAKSGTLRYLSELEEWRHENKGLAWVLTVNSLIRKKVHPLNHDTGRLPHVLEGFARGARQPQAAVE